MKRNKFLKTLPMKLYILLAAVVLFAFFSNDFGLVDIQKTAIILAAGVDGAESGYHFTAQIAVPKGAERTSCGTASVNVEAEGETVSDCVAQIYAKTGWVPKFVFCNLVLLGEELAQSGAMGALDYFLRNEYMQDSCKVATCSGRAADVLKATSAIENTTSASIEQLFSGASEKSGSVMPNNLKDFARGYYGVSKSGYMPYVRSQDQECDGTGSADSKGESKDGKAGGKGSEEAKKIFSAKETAAFYDGRMVALLNEQQTFLFSLIEGKVRAGTYTVEENGVPVSVFVFQSKGDTSIKSGESPVATLSVNVKLRLYNRSSPAEIEDVGRREVSEEILKNARAQLTKTMNELWEIISSTKSDLFQLTRALHRSSRKEYAKWKENLLTQTRVKIEVKTESVR